MGQRRQQRDQDRLWRSIRSPAEPISGISLYWYDKTDYSRQSGKKARIEAAVRNKAPYGATEAWIRCGTHVSCNDSKQHTTVDYVVHGGVRTKHIYA